MSHTGDRTYATYSCHFGGKIYGSNTSKTGCPFFLKYKRQENLDGRYQYTLVASNWMHNHRVDEIFIDAHCCCCSTDEILETQQQQQLKVPPGCIRANLGVATNSNIFYNIRRPVILASKKETISELLSSMKCRNFVSDVTVDEDGTLTRAALLHTAVASHAYATDIVFTDDTVSTNIYGMKVQTMIVEDPESRSQLYAFGYLSGQDQEAYEAFFLSIRTLSGQCPRIIMADRCEAQFGALNKIYPEAHVVFCLRHLGKNLERHFHHDSDVIKGFYAIKKDVRQCDRYMDMITRMIEEDPADFPGKETLKWMVTYADHWVPLRLIQHGVLRDWTTNRDEGYFGWFKQSYGFTLFTLTQLTKNIITSARLLSANSTASIRQTDKRFETLPCDNKELIGALALEVIGRELTAYLNQEDMEPCHLCILRETCPELALPCRHTIDENTPLRAQDLHPRYLRDELAGQMCSQQNLSQVHTDRQRSSDYTEIMSAFAPFAAAANKNSAVNEIIQGTLAKLRATMRELNSHMPPTIAMKGRLSLHPANNVPLSGCGKMKRSYSFSVCGQPGHNKATSPNK